MCGFKETKKAAAVLHSLAKVKEEHPVHRVLPARLVLKDPPGLLDQLVADS
ncbi:MAG TPA: hypothetical protein VFP18_02655 [Candidatus Binatia bacterium]|nr:hypothetical protein [Candidatus Binatia bacterium]